MDSFQIIVEGEEKLEIPKLCKELNARSKRRYYPGDSIEFSREYYDTFKRQYNAVKILDSLPPKTIVLTDKDLYADGLNFVVGASFKERAIVNLHRLYVDNNRILSFERVLKEILHQVGYMSGLGKCTDPSCIMASSASPRNVDKKTINLCQSCTIKLAEMNRRV